MNVPKFSEYNSDEAGAFGKAFVALFVAHKDALRDADDTGQWTEVVFDLFAESIGREDVVLDVHRSKRTPSSAYEANFHAGLRKIVNSSSPRRSNRSMVLREASGVARRPSTQHAAPRQAEREAQSTCDPSTQSCQ